MSALHPAALTEAALLADCEIRRTRRSGPGGQHRNKVETAIVITHRPTGITVDASERRSQEENRRVAVFRMRIQLALAFRQPRPSGQGQGPSPLWQSRSGGGKIAVNSEHDDFPTLLAEALDAVTDRDFDMRAAAADLVCTPSQLTKFLQQEPRALALVNKTRESRGMHKLK
ncbi:MAG: peptide chain release factor-like protein [Planctomycetaceae bacterium]|nr:peptide chain release factor-like protein [Planctomycetaceae bacterium]